MKTTVQKRNFALKKSIFKIESRELQFGNTLFVQV